MKRAKKALSLLLAGTMMFALAACGQSSSSSTASSSTAASQPAESQTASASASSAPSQPESAAASEAPASASAASEAASSEGTGSNVLVVYYSATGNTETVAGYIANALGADTFAITPAEPYSSDDLNWTNEDSRVSREYADPSLRTVELTADTVENWDSYDTVFIGYPIWWGIAAWPTDSFVSANDFTGKTVIPFTTSASSPLGQSGELLAELAGTGDWLEGQRFSSGVSEADVVEWVNGLGLSE